MTSWRGCSLGLEGRGHLQGLTLLLLDAGERVLCTLARFGVGHAEHVVGLNAAIHTRVAGDWLSEHQTRWLLLNAVESLDGLGLGLVSWAVIVTSSWGVAGGVIDLWVLATEEGVHGGWWDWLLQKC